VSEHDAPRVMLDPSLLLAEGTLAYVRSFLEEKPEPVYVPARFLDVGTSSISFDEPGVGAFFGTDERAVALFRDWRPQTDLLVPFQPSAQEIEQNREIVDALRRLRAVDGQELTDDTRETLVQEWVYLKTHSWIGAARDAAAQAFERAGAEAADLGKAAFGKVVELATDDVPRIVRSQPVKWVFAAGAGAGVLTAITVVTGPAAPAAILFAAAMAQQGATDIVKKAFVKIDP
jgi:hypothetical protein